MGEGLDLDHWFKVCTVISLLVDRQPHIFRDAGITIWEKRFTFKVSFLFWINGF
jgi:hypothetical protein